MPENDLRNKLKRLGINLRQAMLHLPIPQDSEEDQRFKGLFHDICEIVFRNDFFNEIWEERILLQLSKLFQLKPPNKTIYGKQIVVISDRTALVRKINDFFFSIINNESSTEDVCTKLSALTGSDEYFELISQLSIYLEQIRSTDKCTSEKISAFLEYITTDLGMNLSQLKTMFSSVIDGIKHHEEQGGVKALLVNSNATCGTVIPLMVKLRHGRGEVSCLVRGSESFQKAIERAREALVEEGFLVDTDNVNYSLEETGADYIGESIGLAAAVGMYSVRGDHLVDSYTAFTGDINIEGKQFKIGASGFLMGMYKILWSTISKT